MPFLKGFTLFFWAAATWWIPLLTVLMIWRHGERRHRLSYDPQFWGMVFPLAMYTTGTYQLARALDLPFLIVIPEVFVFVAFAAWGIIGLVIRGGFPEFRLLRDRERMERCMSYVDSIIERNISAVHPVRKPDSVRCLIYQAASQTSQELNIQSIAQDVGVKRATAAGRRGESSSYPRA